jgi:hypothetical protein
MRSERPGLSYASEGGGKYLTQLRPNLSPPDSDFDTAAFFPPRSTARLVRIHSSTGRNAALPQSFVGFAIIHTSA